MDKFAVLSNIEIYTDKFNATGFFPYAMQVFCWAHANDLPIPKEILDAIAKGFAEWRENGGRKNKGLDDIFKLRPGCSGHSSVLTNEQTESRNRIILSIIETLTTARSWAADKAIEAAYAWVRAQYKAKPKKYRCLKPNNSGRKSDDRLDSSPISFKSIKDDIWGKRNSDLSKIYEDVKKDVAQSMVLQGNEEWEEHMQKLELFYMELIETNGNCRAIKNLF